MPFTPIHMGPGMALKALTGRHFSLVAFGYAQIAMDIEPLVRILRDDEVLHGVTHTYVGALAIAVPTLPIVWFSYPLFSRCWRWLIEGFEWPWLRMFATPDRPSFWPVATGVAVGTFSHVVFDSIMHSDMHPLWPFSIVKPIYKLISIEDLHALCLASGVVGLAIFAVVWLLSKKRA
ncbi:DUF4184 family protein [Pseudomarimonas arenosa]|uniref:DUF4184 family protein n=1 Tax=Pseudomarimonas arenosa TaxID=2774145 RepID=A0AAW3ZI12_9GAMM|nr:DUF4184 family protein [Pseudomarimonas arenosa]MBD8524627.1 DUF4184 family protein [Pseudomarimonas arenosa]